MPPRLIAALALCLIAFRAEATTTLTVDNFAALSADRIFQRVSAATPTKSIPLTGTYTGSAPAVVDCQINIVAGGTALALTATTSFSAGGGTWSGTVPNVPQGAWYEAQCQEHGNAGASGAQTQQWGVGVLVLITGSSNIAEMWYLTPTPLVANQYTRRWNGGGWFLPSAAFQSGENTTWFSAQGGDGVVTLANLIQAGLGGTVPVGVLEHAEPGASIAGWTTIGGSEWTDILTTIGIGGANVGGDWEHTIINTGSCGDSLGTASTYYAADLALAQGVFHTQTGRSNSTGGFGVALSGTISAACGGGRTDDGITQVRQAQSAYALGTAGAFYAGETFSAPFDPGGGSDFVHLTKAGTVRVARRFAQAVLRYLGLAAQSSVGPQIASFYRSGATLTVTVANDTSTGLALPNGSPPPYGFTVSTSNTCAPGSPLTVSSSAIVDATHFTLTLTTAPGVTTYLCHGYGMMTGATTANDNFIMSTPAIAADTIGTALVPTGTTPIAESAAPPAVVVGGGRARFF